MTRSYKKGGSWELQACQSELKAVECYGADRPESNHVAYIGQSGDQA